MNREEEKAQIYGAIILIIIVIIGIGIYAWYDESKSNASQPIEIDKYAFIEKSKIAVKSRLKDPESSQFDNIRFYDANGVHPVACGNVNSKNGFGGYSGSQRFISAARDNIVFFEKDMASAEEFESIWQKLCF